MSKPSESDRKRNEKNNKTLEKQINIRKTERKSEKRKNIHMEKQKESEAPGDGTVEAGPQLSKPTEKQGQTPETKQSDSCDSNNRETQENFNPAQSKYKPLFRGRMRPDPSIQHHPAYPILFEYATNGCPVDCGESWSREHLEAAVSRGPHTSATSKEAATCLRQEALEKVAQGEAEIFKWDDIKDAPHPNLKISPLAAVPHKSRLFRAILDLSFQLRLRGVKFPSVNAETTPMSDHKSMEQMGKVLWRLVTMVASIKNDHTPVVFAKWDIKDGFWRLVVSEEDSWNFCYVLPRENDEDPIEIVRPTCLQMGWSESPPLFCTASETARDVAQEKLDSTSSLEPHPLEQYCIPENFELPKIEHADSNMLAKLLEVYMDDFIGLAQARSKEELVHFSRAVLHGIHTVFPPPGPSDDPSDEPISVKKLKQGDGLWQTQKEILGWLFDGVTKCMQLPTEKVTKIRKTLLKVARAKVVRLGELEKLNGKLMHATIGIPNGRGLLSPLIATIATKGQKRCYKDKTIRLNIDTKQALRDWTTLLELSNRQPTLCADLIPALADYGGYCDASKNGAGGVWFGLEKQLPPIVWRVEFPPDIQQQLVSHENPQGKISNSDLEMVGLILQWLVLENFAELAHAHVACWCDNTPTVAWASRLLSTKAKKAARLLRILALRMIACQASPLTTLHIEGERNHMADFASRSFLDFKNSTDFLTEFHRRFPLPQEASWIEYHFPRKIVGRVLSTLSTETPTLGSWRRLGKRGSVTGGTGSNFFPAVSIHTFRIWMTSNSLWSYRLLLNGQGKVHLGEESESKPEASRQPSGPSPRPLNWLAGETLCTNPEQRTTTPLLPCKRKAIDGKTQQRQNKWQCP